MDAGGKSKAKNAGTESKGNKRKQYLPHNKPVKKKGYPLRPGVQGFFITCDGGRERQASREAVNVIDSFYEELLHGNETKETTAEQLAQPANTKIKFRYSESSSGEEEEDNDDDDDDGSSEEEENGEESRSNTSLEKNADPQNMINKMTDPQKNDEEKSRERLAEAAANVDKNDNVPKDQGKEVVEPPMKKQCLEKDLSKAAVVAEKEEKSVDKLIEAELEELADKNKRHFVSLDSGCNGVVFVQMRRRDGEPGPREIVQHMMTTAASTRKHMSRFILRVLPIEVSCYASEEEISRAIKPLVAQYFPIETETPQKFAVLYDGRANSGIDRMKIINSVAKSIPAPHKVDLNNPDKSIVVQIVKTVCLIGLVEKYKELGKYNLRQLTSSKS